VRLFKNEVSGLGYEVFCSNDAAISFHRGDPQQGDQ
jgi:hypothetical protein